MAFTPVNDGDLAVAPQLQQILDALQGVAGAGQPIDLVALDSDTQVALTVRNLGAGGALQVLSTAGSELLFVDDAGVTFGGTIAFTDIAASNATLTGDLALSGAGKRIKGDFTNATRASRVLFETTTANSPTNVGAIPSGTGTAATLTAFNNAAPDSASVAAQLSATSSAAQLRVESPSASYQPLEVYTNNTKQATLSTAGLLTLHSGGLTTAGAVTVGSGGVSATSGNIAAASGNVSASGTVTAGTGLTVTTGNLLVSAGAITASGNIGTSGGALTASGNIASSAGTISTAGASMTTGGAISGASLSVSGAVTSTGGAVTAATTMTAGTGLTVTTGNATVSAGLLSVSRSSSGNYAATIRNSNASGWGASIRAGTGALQPVLDLLRDSDGAVLHRLLASGLTQLNMTDTSAAVRAMLEFQEAGTARFGVGLDASDRFAVLASDLATARFTVDPTTGDAIAGASVRPNGLSYGLFGNIQTIASGASYNLGTTIIGLAAFYIINTGDGALAFFHDGAAVVSSPGSFATNFGGAGTGLTIGSDPVNTGVNVWHDGVSYKIHNRNAASRTVLWLGLGQP